MISGAQKIVKGINMVFQGGNPSINIDGGGVGAIIQDISGMRVLAQEVEAVVGIYGEAVAESTALFSGGANDFDNLKNATGGSGAGKNANVGKLNIVEEGTYSSSEIKAAKYVSEKGHDVTLRPPKGTRAGGQTSDLLVDNVNYDVYTPETSNPNAIIRAITKKNTQTNGIVLDLSNTTVTESDLGNILERVRGAIEKNGGTCNIFDIIVMPK